MAVRSSKERKEGKKRERSEKTKTGGRWTRIIFQSLWLWSLANPTYKCAKCQPSALAERLVLTADVKGSCGADRWLRSSDPLLHLLPRTGPRVLLTLQQVPKTPPGGAWKRPVMMKEPENEKLRYPVRL